MTKTFTQNDLIRYIYKETSEEENREIKNALLCDLELLDAYQELSATKYQLDRTFKTPSNSVINNILNYSKLLNLDAMVK